MLHNSNGDAKRMIFQHTPCHASVHDGHFLSCHTSDMSWIWHIIAFSAIVCITTPFITGRSCNTPILSNTENNTLMVRLRSFWNLPDVKFILRQRCKAKARRAFFECFTCSRPARMLLVHSPNNPLRCVCIWFTLHEFCLQTFTRYWLYTTSRPPVFLRKIPGQRHRKPKPKKVSSDQQI